MHRGLSIPAREGTPLPSFHVPQTLPQSTLGITPVPHVPGRWQQGSRAGAWALIDCPAESALFLSLQPGHCWNSPPALCRN